MPGRWVGKRVEKRSLVMEVTVHQLVRAETGKEAPPSRGSSAVTGEEIQRTSGPRRRCWIRILFAVTLFVLRALLRLAFSHGPRR